VGGIRGEIVTGVIFLTICEPGLAGGWSADSRLTDPAGADAATRTTVVWVDADIDARTGAVDEGGNASGRDADTINARHINGVTARTGNVAGAAVIRVRGEVVARTERLTVGEARGAPNLGANAPVTNATFADVATLPTVVGVVNERRADPAASAVG
jgi:hypothetical protein